MSARGRAITAAGGDLKVTLQAPGKLSFVKGSANLCVRPAYAQILDVSSGEQYSPESSSDPLVRVPIADEIVDNGVAIGNLRPGSTCGGIACAVFDVIPPN